TAIAHYVWSGPGLVNPPDAPCVTIPAAAVANPGTLTYHVSVTDEHGCPAEDDGTVTVNARATAAVTKPADQCKAASGNNEFTLAASCSGGDAHWEFTCKPAGSNATFGNASACATSAFVDKEGVYCVTLTVTPTQTVEGACPAVSD